MRSSKEIICFIAALSSGGAEHQLSYLANFLTEQGYYVTLVTYGDAVDHYVLSDRVKRVKLAPQESKLKKAISLICYFIKTKADCVISFGARENFMVLLPLLFNRKVKVLAGERCVILGKGSFYNRINYKYLYSRAQFVITNSKAQKNEIMQQWPKLKPKLFTIFNYTAINSINVNTLPNRPFFKIGIFSRYSKQKNYIRFASVIKTLKKQSDAPFEFHWYGNKNDDSGYLLPEYIHFSELISNYGIEDVLFLHDHVKDVVSLFSDFDALSLPSLTEGFSNSLSEYICSGHPVIASNVADNGIMVHDGQNGYLFDPNDEEGMVDSYIKFFHTAYDIRCAMGCESRRIAAKLFDKNNFLNSYIGLIEG